VYTIFTQRRCYQHHALLSTGYTLPNLIAIPSGGGEKKLSEVCMFSSRGSSDNRYVNCTTGALKPARPRQSIRLPGQPFFAA
jgi:hypothetical protein